MEIKQESSWLFTRQMYVSYCSWEDESDVHQLEELLSNEEIARNVRPTSELFKKNGSNSDVNMDVRMPQSRLWKDADGPVEW